jgi:hypothetical protein
MTSAYRPTSPFVRPRTRPASTIATGYLIAAVVATLFIWMAAKPAAAHEALTGWKYPISCCSGYDCRPVSAKWIKEREGAFIIPTTGEAVPYTDRRIKSSPDGEYHWCSKQGKDDTPTICLFVPPRSF